MFSPLKRSVCCIRVARACACSACPFPRACRTFNHVGYRKLGACTCRRVRDLLFGYHDELLSTLATVVPSLAPKTWVSMVPNMTGPGEARALAHNVFATTADSAVYNLVTHGHGYFDDEHAAHKAHDFGGDSDVGAGGSDVQRSGGADAARADQAAANGHASASAIQSAASRRFGAGVTALQSDSKAASKGFRFPIWEYVEWEGHREVRCWNNHSEAVYGGTDALQFRPGLTEADSVYIFVPELFRMAKLNVTGEVRSMCNSPVHGELVRLLLRLMPRQHIVCDIGHVSSGARWQASTTTRLHPARGSVLTMQASAFDGPCVSC